MEGRVIEYRPHGGGLDYHNSPLIGEIPNSEHYNSHMHRSIEQLRSLNERGILNQSPTESNYKAYNNNNNNNTEINSEQLDYLHTDQLDDKNELKLIHKNEMDYQMSLGAASPVPPISPALSTGSLVHGKRKKNRKKVKIENLCLLGGCL